MDTLLAGMVERADECAEVPDTEFAYFSAPLPGVRLFIYGGSRDRECVVIDGLGEYLFGRAKESFFRFSDDNRTDVQVSRRHALLRVGSGSVILRNQTPRNGLLVNGISLADYQQVVLNDADVITLGGNGPNIRVRIGDLGVLSEGRDDV